MELTKQPTEKNLNDLSVKTVLLKYTTEIVTTNLPFFRQKIRIKKK